MNLTTILFAALAAILLVLMLVDLLQTEVIAANPHRWHERNRVIKAILARTDPERHGKVLRRYFLFALITALIVAVALWMNVDPWAGLGWLLVNVTLEGWCVRNNHRIGVRVDFEA